MEGVLRMLKDRPGRNSYAGPGLVRGVIAPLAPPPERNMGPLARTPLSAVDMGAACLLLTADKRTC